MNFVGSDEFIRDNGRCKGSGGRAADVYPSFGTTPQDIFLCRDFELLTNFFSPI